MKKTFYVTTPIYYVNAKPHLGHAYTTIFADTVCRFHKLMGEETFFLTGTDEHGDKIVQAAESQGKSPQEYVDEISALFRNLWPELDIENDKFIRTTDPYHKECVQRFLQIVYDKGDIYFGEYGGYYCFGCERFYTEKELVDGMCPDHKKPPTYIHEENYFFRMSKYQDWLREYINDNPDFIQPEPYRKEVLSMLKEPIGDLCISRPKKRLTWGIEMPFDKNFVTYVWFDALINYLSAIGWPDSEEFKKFWPAYHIIAKDILKPHAIFWPTMLKSAGVEIYKGLRVHGYWKVDETKMSKSLGNVVDPLSLKDKYGVDGFRYFLMREMHFGHDGNFSEKNMIERFNADLANDIGNLFNRTLSMINKYFKGKLKSQISFEDMDKELILLGKRSLNNYITSFESFNSAEGLENLMIFVRAVNKYIDSVAPWTLFKNKDLDRLNTVLWVVLICLRKIALALWPVMPSSSEKMLNAIGLALDVKSFDFKREADDFSTWEISDNLPKNLNLFPRKEVFKEEKPKKEAKSSKNEEQESYIDFDVFQKVDLRVGKVLDAAKHPNADKLLCLKVDLGEQKPRSVVAGIAKYYKPDELIGKNVVMVANLKPRKLRGEISEGMVLAVHKKDGLQVLAINGEIDPGSKIS
ncbi:methionine--tRNA ligase [Desulfothermus sp.]